MFDRDETAYDYLCTKYQLFRLNSGSTLLVDNTTTIVKFQPCMRRLISSLTASLHLCLQFMVVDRIERGYYDDHFVDRADIFSIVVQVSLRLCRGSSVQILGFHGCFESRLVCEN